MLSPAELRRRAAALRDAPPESVVTWALAAFPGRTALTVSFGGGGVVLAHIVSRVDRSVPVLFLDTGFHFPETLAFKDAFVARYGLNLVELRPLTDGVPYHPLLDRGYTSIGCWPCPRATAPGEPERAGRWSGTGKTECGLHTFP